MGACVPEKRMEKAMNWIVRFYEYAFEHIRSDEVLLRDENLSWTDEAGVRRKLVVLDGMFMEVTIDEDVD